MLSILQAIVLFFSSLKFEILSKKSNNKREDFCIKMGYFEGILWQSELIKSNHYNKYTDKEKRYTLLSLTHHTCSEIAGIISYVHYLLMIAFY